VTPLSDENPPPGAKVVITTSEVQIPSLQQRAARYQGLFDAATAGAPPRLAPVLKCLGPVLGFGIAIFQALLPFFMAFFNICAKFYAIVPTDLLEAGMGVIFCFAGGLYPTLFAACEAARLTGWD